MAINIDNWGYISAGQTIGVGFYLNGGQGAGSQWFEGTPQDAGNTLTTNNSRISLGTDSKFVYAFDLRCDGVGTRFGLHGGGQT